MQKTVGWLLILQIGFFAGCPSNNGDQSDVAGHAYIENEDGKLELATAEGSGGHRSAPTRPAGSEADWLKNFELTERSGRLVNSESLKGQPYVLSFFFSTCPTICKRQNEKVSQLQKQFKGQPIRLVSITCDPEVDVPEVLSIYADGFQADKDQWLFLTGEMTYLRRVGAEMFFLAVDFRFHAEKLLLIDGDGKIYGSYDWNQEEQFQLLQADMTAMIQAGGRLPEKAQSPKTPNIDPEDL